MSAQPPLPSGWFPDPHGRHDHRWFNGTAWTADVADDGQRLVDPLGAAPSVGGGHARAHGEGNGVATGALTCGLIALAFAWMPVLVVIGVVLGMLGLFLGVSGLRRARQVGSGRGMALTGIISGSAALALSSVGIVFTVSLIREVTRFISPGPVDTEVVSCEVGPGSIVVEATITNLRDRVRDYTVFGVVAEPRGVSDLVAEVSRVDAGETERFQLRRSLVSDEPDGACDVRLVVHGPTPYGLDMERVND